MRLNRRWDTPVFRNLIGDKQRVEAFRIEIMEYDVVPGFPHVITNRVGDCMV